MSQEILPHKCPNCDHPFTGNYCPNCGQSTRELNRPFGQMFRDLLDSIFEFDTRFLKTIKPLLFKPGFLTSEYVMGRRKSYYPPFKLYIFVSIILFALLEISSADLLSTGLVNVNPYDRDSTSVDSMELNRIVTDTSGIPVIIDTVIFRSGKDTIYMDYVLAGDTLNTNEEIINSLKEYTDSLPSKEWFRKRLLQGAITVFESPDYSWNMFLKRLSQALFLLLPVFALLLKLLYIRSGRLYIQHFVFSIYFHTFAFFVLTIVILAFIVFDGLPQKISGFLLILIPFYLFLGIKRFYFQPFFKTLVKFFTLSFIYTFVLLFGVLGILILTLVLM